MYEYAATVVKVVDGDTLDLDVDLGFSVHRHERVRLRGVNTPEKGTPGAAAAVAFVRAWLEAHGPAVLVRTEKDRREKYGRMLALVYPVGATGTEALNHELLLNGHAQQYDGGKR